jgi:hypothetical protein
LRHLKPDAPSVWVWSDEQTVGGPCDAGLVDDSAPQVRFSQQWRRLQKYGDACGGTITYTDAQGAEVTFPFTGTGVTYLFVKASTGGMAEVAIDKVKRGVVDLYSDHIEWRARAAFGGLRPGAHTLTLRVLRQKRVESHDYAVNVDAFLQK